MMRFLTALMVGFAALVQAQSVTLAWEPSPSPGVDNYRVYFGTNSGSYGFVTNAGLVRTQAVVLPHTGLWFFAATAVDTYGVESEFSNEVEWEARPAPPVVTSERWLRVVPELWRSTNHVDWVSFEAEPTWVAATNQIEMFTMRGLRIERVERVREP